MNDEQLEWLGGVRDEMDVSSQQFESLQKPEGATGSDRSESVKVTIDAAGRVCEVSVSSGWRRQLEIDGLSEAVLEAAGEASSAQMRAWEVSAERGSAFKPVARPMPLSHETVAGQLADRVRPEAFNERCNVVLEEMVAMLEEVSRSLDEVTSQVESRLSSTFQGSSKSGRTKATITGAGDIADVHCDRRWLTNAHEYNIGRELTEAFQDAYRRMDSTTDSPAMNALKDLQSIASDPNKLARRLYLTDN